MRLPGGSLSDAGLMAVEPAVEPSGDVAAETARAVLRSPLSVDASSHEENVVTETAAPALQLAGDYEVDPAHSRIGFTARHAMVTKVRGSFGMFRGTARIADDATASSTSIVIQADSFTTNQEQRDGHVKGGDFLDVEAYPEITFASTAVERVDDETFRITGDLTVRDVTRPVTVDFAFTGLAKDPFGNVRAGFEGSTTITRSDYGITFNAALETGGVLVSDKVGLEFDISAVQQA